MIVNVLDRGYVRLVDRMGDLKRVADAARVSHNNDGPSNPRNPNLIRYLLDHGHTSPFEHVVFTFEVKAPIFVLRQWMRHRTWSFNEVSARYTPLDDDYYVPAPDKIGHQSTTNHQARILDGLNIEAYNIMNNRMRETFTLYNTLMANGVPREVARMILPFATYSRMYATVDLHNLMNFIRLRDAPDAQWEIQEYARAIRQLIPELQETLED